MIEVCLYFAFKCNNDCILRLSFLVLQNKHYEASFEIRLGCYNLIAIIVIPLYPVLKRKGEYMKGGTATLPVGGSHSITSKL